MGTDPYAYELSSGTSSLLGTLGGASITMSTDLQCDGGAVYFMGKDDWNTGGESVIYRVVPEPAAMAMAAAVLLLVRRR
jgi:hypothetical protein